jgi:hypothetical protein
MGAWNFTISLSLHGCYSFARRNCGFIAVLVWYHSPVTLLSKSFLPGRRHMPQGDSLFLRAQVVHSETRSPYFELHVGAVVVRPQ